MKGGGDLPPPANLRRQASPATAEAVAQPQAEPIASAGQAVVPFSFEGKPVRAVTSDGEPWFVLADVCRVLEHSNPSQAASRLDVDERGIITGDTPSGQQAMVIISESGLYSLILTSRKPEAKTFKKWVTGTVLPTIRKTGVYVAPGANVEAIRAALAPIQAQIAKLDQDNALLAEQVRTLTITGDPRLSAVTHISAVDICTKWQIGAAINAAVGPRYAGHPTEERACRRSHARQRHRRRPPRTIPCGATCSTTSAALHRPRHPRPSRLQRRHPESRRRHSERGDRPRSPRRSSSIPDRGQRQAWQSQFVGRFPDECGGIG